MASEAISPAMRWLACCADPHWQSTVWAPVCQGSPALSQAVRVTLFDCSPAWVTQPPTTCSTSIGSMPERSTTACWASAEQLRRMQPGQPSAALADRRANRLDDDRGAHLITPRPNGNGEASASHLSN